MPKLKQTLNHECLSLERAADQSVLRFRCVKELSLGSERRTRQVKRRVEQLIRKAKPQELTIGTSELHAVFGEEGAEDAERLFEKLTRAIEDLKTERLYPSTVEEILNITSRERMRWTKDGRLPKSGTGSFRRGAKSIHFPLHPQRQIAALAATPERIAAWREADRG